MFDSSSRFADAGTYAVTDRRGRTVTVVTPAEPVGSNLLGYHERRADERLDLLAGRYLRDPTQWWRICDEADVMLPESLSQALEIPIPRRS